MRLILGALLSILMKKGKKDVARKILNTSLENASLKLNVVNNEKVIITTVTAKHVSSTVLGTFSSNV